MAETSPQHDVETRVEDLAQESNLHWVLDAIVAQREEILRRWGAVAAAQPFHRDRRERAITDHIPLLLDALIAYLQRAAPPTIDPAAPLDDSAIQIAAQGHALMRIEQGLQPSDVLTEFRLLRQELWLALRVSVPTIAPTSDVVSAELLVNDALDGAMALALAALTAQIEQMREEFLAATMHEVRQPLTSIGGFAQLAQRALNRPDPDLDQVRMSLRSVEHATQELGRMLSDLIDASRTALGGIVLQPGPTDMARLIKEVVDHIPPEVADRVHVEPVAEGTMTGQWDAGRLAQVVTNLLSNAAKYSPPDTLITVRMEEHGASIRLTVRDEGIGIPDEDLPRLFQRYARASNAMDEHIDGLGLGLYVCRGIVEAHGGRIWAASSGPGRGTTISVELPCELPGPVSGEIDAADDGLPRPLSTRERGLRV